MRFLAICKRMNMRRKQAFIRCVDFFRNISWVFNHALRVYPFVILMLIVGITLFVFLQSNLWFPVPQISRYAILLDHFRDAFHDGQWYPRWLPELNGAYGYPTFVFYQPGFFFFALPFTALPGYPEMSFKSVIFLMFFIGASGTYLLFRDYLNRAMSLLGSAFFILTPYIFVDLYVRGDLSELLAMMLCPWPLFFFSRFYGGRLNSSRAIGSLIGIAVSLAFIVYSHPLIAEFLIPTYFVLFTYCCLASPRLKGISRFIQMCLIALSFIVAIVISAPYWLTVIRMMKYIDLSGTYAGYYAPTNHLVYFSQFFSLFWGFGGSGPGPSDDMSFQIGIFHFLAALLGAWFGRRSRLVQISFSLYLLIIGIISPLGSAFWSIPIKWIQAVQFPWRLLAIIASLQIFAVISLFKKIQVSRFFSILLSLYIVLAAVIYHNQFTPSVGGFSLSWELNNARSKEREEFQFYADIDEFRPLSSRSNPIAEPRHDQPILVSSEQASIVPAADNNPSFIHFFVNSASGTLITLNQIYLPGWAIGIDGERIERDFIEQFLASDGRIQIPLLRGTHEIQASYAGLPGQQQLNIVCFIFLSLLLVLWIWGFWCPERNLSNWKVLKQRSAERSL
ncbi:MAG: hypothetical protein WCG83_06055 [Candidatus Peregrinibacteria bacterium]